MNINNIQTIIDSYAQNLSGKFGVFFKDLNTGVSCGTNINEVFPTASMAKVYILAELYKLANDGGIVYTRKGDYILIMMYNANTADEAEYKNNKKGSYSDFALANMSLEIFKEYIH